MRHWHRLYRVESLKHSKILWDIIHTKKTTIVRGLRDHPLSTPEKISGKIRFLTLSFFFFYVDFLSQTFTNHRTAGEGRGYFINSSLPLPPASQTLRHQPGDYCRELTSADSQQPESNRKPLVSERKSLTTKLRATKPRSTLW